MLLLSSHGWRSIKKGECSEPTPIAQHDQQYMYIFFSDQVATETVEAVALFIELCYVS